MASDEKWWKPQERTFTRWVNSNLRGHLTSNQNRVQDLSTDLADGRVLGELIEKISKSKLRFMREDRQLKFKPQKLENLGVSFRFMEKEHIKLVNIGPEDIFAGNLKLIMGLIWTLIGRYQIRSTGRALSTKDAMLAWVNTQLPEMHIKNFTKDWNDGIAICALVDRIQPGLIPHAASLSPSDKLKNCSLGMGLADDKLNIPKLMDPQDLSHPDVDEISVMTYISYFCEPANAHLLKWVQATIPERGIKNFTKDWNNGINLACLLEALNPGGFPNCEKLDPNSAIDNLTQGMKMAEDQLGIKPILKPDQMADPNVDELNIVTYLSRFQNAKPLPQPQAISCSGEGLRKAVVEQAAVFEVDATKGGTGDLEVVITCSGKPLTAKITPNFGKKSIFAVNYTPESAGQLSISIKWSGMEIPTSPYSINVVDPKAVSITGPEITGKNTARVGQKVVMEVKGVADLTDLEVTVQSPTGHVEEAKLVSKSKGVAECSYTPRVVGTDKVTAKVTGISIPGSPFNVKVIDPMLFSVSLRDPPPEKPVPINSKATFVVSAEKGKVEGVVAEYMSPSGPTDVPMRAEGASSSVGVVTPASAGKQEVRVTCNGDDIKGSPITFQVFDVSKCVLDDLPKYLNVGETFDARLATQGAGKGSAQAKSSDSVVLTLECKEGAGKNYDIRLIPKKVGSCSVSVDWNGNTIPKTPHELSVCDSTKCIASGRGLTEGKGKTKEPFEFTVHTTGAGKGEMSILPKGPKSTIVADITKVSDAKYNVSFTTFETGDHSIEITWCGKVIPNSPYTVNFYKPAAASSFTATGEGLKTAVAMKAAKVMIMGPESGLLSKDILKISIGNGTIKSTMVSKAKFKPETGKAKAMVFATDNGNGAYEVEYVVPTSGKYSLSITSDKEDIPGSPFAVTALPAADAGKCVAFGQAIDNPSALLVGTSLEFKVDSTNAGTGELAVTCKDPKGANVSVFLAEDAGKRVHSIKIDLKSQGKHDVTVQWSGKGIPKSPFTFHASDHKEVIIMDLPDCEDYVGRKGEPLSFSVDTRKAGTGELKGTAKYEDGKAETFTQKKNKDGTVKLSHAPTKVGEMELLLTFSGANILPNRWIVLIADPNAFKVIPPRDPVKVGEYVKFVIIGLKKKQAKNMAISAKNRTHDATVKFQFSDQGQAVARFTAKEAGEYNVEVKVANKDVPGSPFKALVANPDGCVISEEIPTVVPVGVEKQFVVDTAKAGPAGDLTVECTGEDGTPSECLFSTVSAGAKKTVKMTGKVCGKVSFGVKFAGFLITSMPVDVFVTDPSKCSFTCKGIENGLCKTDGSITVDIDTIQGGNCPPELVIKGPKSNYDVELKRITEGRYTAALTPWQDGKNTIQVTAGGVDVTGSPMNFESRKPLDIDKVTVSGPGLAGAVANRQAEVIIYARESMLVDKGVLNIAFPEGAVGDFEVYDKLNGTYNVSFTPKQTGTVKLSVTGDGADVGGSPFNIPVVPEPDASECRIQNRSGEEVFKDTSFIYHRVKTPFELGVVTTKAGSGNLVATGQAPNKSQIRVFTNTERKNGDSISYIKFDPSFIGVYTLSLTWDKQHLKGSPYSIMVMDPSKCIFIEPFPSCIKLGDETDCEVDASAAGEGKLEVFVKGPEAEATVKEGGSGAWIVSMKGVGLGSTSVDVKFGGFSVGSSPYALTVCDPTKCEVDFTPGIYNLNAPVKFTVRAVDAGRAKLQVMSSKKGSSATRSIQESTLEVVFTPKEAGEHHLRLLWGEWDIGESPYAITVCDPGLVKTEGVPRPNGILPMGEPVTFTVDTSEAGAGTLACHTISDDGPPEDVNMEETDSTPGITSVQFVPKSPGKIQLVLEFNGMDILQKPHVYDVPDPSHFQVTPPKGYSRVKEAVKFTVTGVGKHTHLSITATHPEDDDVTVKSARGMESNMIIAELTPNTIGDYEIQVKHIGKHINGSPFTVQVCDPDACKFIGKIPSVVHVGVEPDIQVDTSEAGPGELTFETELLAGMEQGLTTSEDKSKWVLSLGEGVGKIRVTTLYGGYNIPNSPFLLTIVDSQLVKWSCEVLDSKDSLVQGELMKILVDGRDAGETVPQVTAEGPDEEYPIKIADNEDGTFMVALNAWQIGRNEVKILWGGKAIPDTPIAFEVTKDIEARAITVSGLDGAVALCEADIMINALESGLMEHGLLEAKFEAGEEDEELPTYDVSDEGKGKYRLSFVAPKEGIYILSIKYRDSHIPNSPFFIKVSVPPDAAKCRAFGEALEGTSALFIADDPVKFSVDTSEAGKGSLSISAARPDEEPMYVYTMEKGNVHHLKFDPVLVGHHTVEVKWGGVDIPGSPFDFNVVDPTKCVLEGIPQEGSVHVIDEAMDFTALVKGIGECTPVVKANTKGETIEMNSLETSEKEVLKYSYKAKAFGKTSISVTVGGEHVPKSPFSFVVVDPNKFAITGVSLKGDYAIVCEPVTIEITGQASEDEDLFVTAHGPSADLSVETVQKTDELHAATFVPIEPGSYEVFVEYAGSHVTGSPTSIKVADPSKCQLLGGMLSSLQVNEVGEITVKTRGAGEGELKAFVKHEDDSFPALECKVKDVGLDTYTIFLTGLHIGKAAIDLQWADFSIPSSPFLVNVCDASKCRAHGQALETKKGKAGSPVLFTVETADAGEGELEVIAKGPSAQYTVNISELKESTSEVSFTPWEIGQHQVQVFWGKGKIPDSPFSIVVGSPLEMDICNATGDGLKHGIASQKATFTIFCSEAGLLDKDVLKVNVMGVKSHADVVLSDNNNGCYTVEYIPPTPGAYVASILFHDRHIPGSPFKITVDSGPDASKCKAYGPALHPNTLAIAGSLLEFFVDTTAAGYGNLKVYIQGPNDYRPKVFMADDEKGIFSIKFDAMKAGKYFILVVWSDKHIPNSPFRIRVHPAANAGKVKAFGPGLLDSFIGTPGQFTVETKNAGIGTLLVRVHGLKDSFKIDARPLSEDDTRTLIITYNPKLVGEYTIFVRWSGVHVPGSPFTINIKQKPGEHDPAAEPLRIKTRKKLVTTPEKKAVTSEKKAVVQKAAPADQRKQRPVSTSSSKDSQPQTTPQRKLSPAPQPVLKKSPSGAGIGMTLIGPAAPGAMKLRDNPAMAKTLAQSLPPGSGGYVAQQQAVSYSAMQQKRVVQKKMVRKVVRKRQRSSSGARSQSKEGRSVAPGRAVSPRRDEAIPPSRRSRAMSPAKKEDSRSAQKKVTSPSRGAAVSPTRTAASPTRKTSPPPRQTSIPAQKDAPPSSRVPATSPTRKTTPPAQKAASPVRKPTTPTQQAATSPTRKTTPPAQKATSPAHKPATSTQQASSPTRQATSPTRKASQKAASPAPKAASPGRKATSPDPRSKPKRRVVKKGSRAKSPTPRHPPPKGKNPPPKKDAKPSKP